MSIKQDLKELFKKWGGESALAISKMPSHGSNRDYYRISGKNKKAIGVYNEDRKENIAFLGFSKHFFNQGLNVPQIYQEDLEKNIYLEEDLGDETLFSYLSKERSEEGFSDNIVGVYENVIDILPKFQILAGKGLDYDICYPRHSFDHQSMMWDLNYFKYYFLKLANIPFNEQQLEYDFKAFIDFLLSAPRDFFLYRDFQSRNIMLHKDKPYFIDYQGGRKGALQYDLASLLFDAKADIPNEIRQHLLEYYMEVLNNDYMNVDRQKFTQYYYGYVFIRIMQALGAYGFRGFYERKEHFLRSVPYAIQNLEWLLHNVELHVKLPALNQAWNGLVRSTFLRQLGDVELSITVRIQSFSYRRGIPIDDKGHGGGFVFDCRLLPNPAQQEKYKDLTGNDKPVIDFFQSKEEVHQFLAHVKKIAEQAVKNYQQRNFTDLLIAFGCTGGQHRSVYCANVLADYLKNDLGVQVEVRHRERELIG